MKRSLKLGTAMLLATASVGLTHVAQAQDPGRPNAAATEGRVADARPAEKLNAALVTADVGRQLQDPIMLASAARTVLSVQGEAGDAPSANGVADNAKPAAGPTTRSERPRDIATRLLDEAQALAAGDAGAMAYIRSVRETASRGNVAGIHRHNVRLLSRRSIDYNERFVGGQLAEVALAGDGDTDLDLVVFDASGNRVCSSTGNSDREYCRWTPAWTGNFTVRVTNYGSVYNDAVVVVN